MTLFSWRVTSRDASVEPLPSPPDSVWPPATEREREREREKERERENLIHTMQPHKSIHTIIH